MEDNDTVRSVEEEDLLVPSVKKHKRLAVGEPGSPCGMNDEIRAGWADLFHSNTDTSQEL